MDAFKEVDHLRRAGRIESVQRLAKQGLGHGGQPLRTDAGNLPGKFLQIAELSLRHPVAAGTIAAGTIAAGTIAAGTIATTAVAVGSRQRAQGCCCRRLPVLGATAGSSWRPRRTVRGQLFLDRATADRKGVLDMIMERLEVLRQQTRFGFEFHAA